MPELCCVQAPRPRPALRELSLVGRETHRPPASAPSASGAGDSAEPSPALGSQRRQGQTHQPGAAIYAAGAEPCRCQSRSAPAWVRDKGGAVTKLEHRAGEAHKGGGTVPGGTREPWRAFSRTAKWLDLLRPPGHRAPHPAPLQPGTGPREALPGTGLPPPWQGHRRSFLSCYSASCI